MVVGRGSSVQSLGSSTQPAPATASRLQLSQTSRSQSAAGWSETWRLHQWEASAAETAVCTAGTGRGGGQGGPLPRLVRGWGDGAAVLACSAALWSLSQYTLPILSHPPSPSSSDIMCTVTRTTAAALSPLSTGPGWGMLLSSNCCSLSESG